MQLAATRATEFPRQHDLRCHGCPQRNEIRARTGEEEEEEEVLSTKRAFVVAKAQQCE
jgi:hypothetical protein